MREWINTLSLSLIAFAFALLASEFACASSSYRVTTRGGAKVFYTKREAVQFILINAREVERIEETREVVLNDRLSFVAKKKGK
jgi:hypothetical protein